MNKAPTKKKRVEAISEEHTFTASPVDSQDACPVAGQPRETIIHVKKDAMDTDTACHASSPQLGASFTV
ncbi:hypothetical protein E2C01_076962 [Portunus trituberculatus]|uniref:Uncharacterized protein n=1 Tax=Portunus trituberculatus TaxID=210409 RepID=A0A5B7IQ15_PORTR|nr:hypothetical protein [Portunus trituberculatus]